MRFLHTADWQIGKPFQSIEDHGKRENLRQQRVDTIRNLKTLIDEQELSFVVVCGDLFDSATPDTSTVAAFCAAVGHLKVPVYAIPGNHDHGGPGCIWNQEFFRREQEEKAHNFHILLEPTPVITDSAVILPCPLLRRHENEDPVAWLRTEPEDLPEHLPRIVLAHGSTQGFSSSGETDSAEVINRIDLKTLPNAAYDYIALGDWHGMKEISPKAWFSGTPEQDRFAKGAGNLPGHALIVEIQKPRQLTGVMPLRTGRVGWHNPDDFHLTNDEDLDTLKSQLNTLLDQENNRDLLKLRVHGTLSYSGFERYEKLIESLQARLIRVDIDSELEVEPTEEELTALMARQDPLIAQVAKELHGSSESDALNRDVLRELHLLLRRVEA